MNAKIPFSEHQIHFIHPANQEALTATHVKNASSICLFSQD